MAMAQAVIVVDEKDNVATALRGLDEGEPLRIETGQGALEVTIRQAISFGHKLALADIEMGKPVIKYGEVIGVARANITKGEHVHVHNVVGPKGRGDAR